ncbi:AI-2E family transporter [Peteryoungia desertarenae]|uniref:AI-2E family transporter n=1 Tax=Peteryoungia desertarenae TaxID=1813451 RepID=A0ABX6QM14_9HYPH|nr:AI-2E family transporter [Peteryoungia desertarenae]QLF69575.1 AI-2E family transporter [Peteryoungia desertarenae]
MNAVGPRRQSAGRLHRTSLRKTGLDYAVTWSVIGLFLIFALIALHLASFILIPLTLAVVTGLILGLAADKLGTLGMPPMLNALLLTSAFAVIALMVGSAVMEPVQNLLGDAPDMIDGALDYIMPRVEHVSWLHRPLQALIHGPISSETMLENTGTIISTLATGVTPALLQILIFLGSLVLFLANRLAIRRALIIGFQDRERRLIAIRAYNAVERALGFYFATALVLYAAFGTVAAIIAMLGGLGSPVLWGLSAFLLSFIPFLGIALVTLAMSISGLLVHDGVLLGLLPAAAFFLVNGIFENLVLPAVMGRRLQMNAFMLFVAIVFWTWLWGGVGAMLAVPLSLIVVTLASELLPKGKAKPSLPQ